jgi:hypothetical protein
MTQPITVFTVQLLYTVKEKGGRPYPLPYGLRNPYRNLKSENSQDYALKRQRNCTFMNSASVLTVCTVFFHRDVGPSCLLVVLHVQK